MLSETPAASLREISEEISEFGLNMYRVNGWLLQHKTKVTVHLNKTADTVLLGG